MKYTVRAERSVAKDLKPFEKPLKDYILQTFEKLGSQPFSGQKLSGPLSQIYSYHLKYKGKDCRIAYTIDKKERIVTILFVGPREKFYKRLKRKLR